LQDVWAFRRTLSWQRIISAFAYVISLAVLIRHSETAATSLNTLKTFAKLAVSSCLAVHSHFCRRVVRPFEFAIAGEALSIVGIDVREDWVVHSQRQIGQALPSGCALLPETAMPGETAVMQLPPECHREPLG
jgi:hypothetical protein